MKEVNLQPGEIALYQGTKVTIRKVVALNKIMVQPEGKKSLIVERTQLSFLTEEEKDVEHVGSTLEASQKAWDEAHRKYKLIESALQDPGNGKIVQKIAKDNSINPATIYRWIDKYIAAGSVEGLLEGRGIKNIGKKKLEQEVEEIIDESIQTVYLKKGERKSIQRVIEDVQSKCRKLKYDCPHPNSIRKRINEVDEKLAAERRGNKKKAREKFGEKPGHFSEGERAMAFVQIDHTPVDLLIVDRIFREPIGPPWLTIALDIKTRYPLGYYLGFDAPSRLSAGQCVANMINRKEHLLKVLNIKGDWPAWGSPARIGVDNAKEFRSKSFERSCKKYRIHVNWRRKGTPEDGGYIESFNKTLENEVHNLPGTKFSSVKDRDVYESEKKAAMTFDQFERWLVEFLVNKYPHKMHSKLKTSPYAEWEKEIVGTETTPAIGYQKSPDAERVSIDYLPEEFRTVQDYGVSINGINYYDPVLKSWINRTGKVSGKKKIRHEFRWDPRNLRYIYFFDPELKKYFKVPYANLAHPDVNIWEWRAVLKHLRTIGEKNIDENRRFQAIEDMRKIEDEAVSETAQIRAARNSARKQNSQKPATPTVKEEIDYLSKIDIKKLKSYL